MRHPNLALCSLEPDLQRSPFSASPFAPTEDAISHLRVPLANPAASNQVFDFTVPYLPRISRVFDFYRPCTRPQNLECLTFTVPALVAVSEFLTLPSLHSSQNPEFLTFTVPPLVAEFIPFPSCFPSAYYTAPTASVFASEVLQLPVCPSQSLPPPSASISVLPCHPHIHSSNRFHESLHRRTSSLLTLFRGFTASFANNMGLGYSVGG